MNANPRERISCPEPGVYRDVSHSEYLSWSACSASRLSDMERSAAYCRYQIGHHEEPTEAMEFGTAVHMLLLEPARFDRTYEARISGSGVTHEVKADVARINGAGRIALKPAAWDDLMGMRGSVNGHDLAGKLLAVPECDRELSIVWDQMTPSGIPVRCKARPDLYDPESELIVDVKSSIKAHPGLFPRAMFAAGYHRAAALYLAGMAAVGLACDSYLFLAIEKTAPFEVALYAIEGASVEVGRDSFLSLLDRYGRCQLKNEWPPYPGGVIPLALPGWAFKAAGLKEMEADD